MSDDFLSEVQTDTALLEAHKTIESLQKRLTKAEAKTERYVEEIYRAVKDAAVAVGLRPAVKPPVRDKRSKKQEVALQHLTDWQGGKKSISYGLDVMDARVMEFWASTRRITEIAREAHPVKNTCIMFGGDMLEGVSIFPGQVWELDADLFQQVFRVADLIERTILFNLSIFEKVHVVAEPGNHGRIGKRSDGIKLSDNMDRIIYEIARGKLQQYINEKRLTWVSEPDFYQRVEIGNYSAMLIHGDEIKSFGGNIPAYGILKKCNAWAGGAISWKFMDVYIGHYHQQMELQLANGNQVYMTGSTESDNRFAAEFVGATSRPSQRLHFIDPEKGRVTSQYKIWLDSVGE